MNLPGKSGQLTRFRIVMGSGKRMKDVAEGTLNANAEKKSIGNAVTVQPILKDASRWLENSL